MRGWYKGRHEQLLLNTVPQSDSGFETFAAPVADWAARLTAGLTNSVRVRGQTLGHMEE